MSDDLSTNAKLDARYDLRLLGWWPVVMPGRIASPIAVALGNGWLAIGYALAAGSVAMWGP